MRTLSLVAAIAVSCCLAGCTGLAATASLTDCSKRVMSMTPSEKEVNLSFHLIVETADHQRTDITAQRRCYFSGFDAQCQFSTRGGVPRPVWNEGLLSGAQHFNVKGKTFSLTYPDCKTAMTMRLPANADLPKSVEDVAQGDGLWRDHMVYTALRFHVTDETGRAFEGNLMSDHAMDKLGFKLVWATVR